MGGACLRRNRQQKRASSLFRRDTCPGDQDWPDLPPGVDIDLHVVARGNTNNLRATLTSLAQACYPEVGVLPTGVIVHSVCVY